MKFFKGSRVIPCTVLLVLQIQSVYSANFLFFFAVSTYSHRIPVWPLIEKLVESGHEVTFVSPFTPKQPHPKVKEFQPLAVTEFYEKNEEGPIAIPMRKSGLIDSSWWVLPDWGISMCETFLSSPDTQEWLKNNKFDMVVIDGLFNDCGLGLAYKYRAPHIIFDTSAPFMWDYDSHGLPLETSWIPDMQYHFDQEMGFMSRFWTTYNQLVWALDREYNYLPKLTEVMRKGLNIPDMPQLREVERNVSLILMNSHFSEEFARSLPPLVVPVAGMHIKEKASPLSKELEEFIKKSGDRGFVYISFGSAVQFTTAPPEIQEAFFAAIRRMKVHFIWKWEDETPKDIPSNLFLQKWMPQQDILGHPKIRAFVTHSGLMSTQEAISFAVPVLAFPIFAEQDYNAERIHNGGYGIRMEIITVTTDKIVESITKLIQEPKYKAKMVKMSHRFKDRPMKAVDTALWWTEFVLRQKDTSYLKPRSIYQNPFVKRSLDVYTVALLLLLLAIYIPVRIVRKVLRRAFSETPITELNHNKIKRS